MITNPSTLFLDFDLRLYSPHRKFILDEIQKDNNSTRLNLSNITQEELIKSIENSISNHNIDFILVDPWIHLIDKRGKSFLTFNLINDKEFHEKCNLIDNFLIKETNTKKIILGAWTDIHSFTLNDTKKLSLLLKRDDYYYWGLGSDDYKNLESFDVNTIKNFAKPTTHYNDLILNNKLENKIIPYLHSIPDDFIFKINNFNLSNKEFHIHVP